MDAAIAILDARLGNVSDAFAQPGLLGTAGLVVVGGAIQGIRPTMMSSLFSLPAAE
jgi:hypothetical protein